MTYPTPLDLVLQELNAMRRRIKVAPLDQAAALCYRLRVGLQQIGDVLQKTQAQTLLVYVGQEWRREGYILSKVEFQFPRVLAALPGAIQHNVVGCK